MADWYISSAAYAAIPQWAATTAYTVGQIIRPVTPAGSGNQVYPFRCTTAGTTAGTEPTWGTAGNDGNTITSGTAVFTDVAGQSTYGWGAAAGTLYSISDSVNRRPSPGDRIFVSSDHSESLASPNVYSYYAVAGYDLVQIISVNRAGSVPPVAADVQSGAAVNVTAGILALDAYRNLYWQGITFTYAATTSVRFNSGGTKGHYFKNCAFVFTGASAFNVISNNPAKVVFDHTTFQFGHTGQLISSSNSLDITWINTPSAIAGATIPSTLFSSSSNGPQLVTCRGVDLSAITGTLVVSSSGGGCFNRTLFDSCRIASGVTRYGTPGASVPAGEVVELVNCYDGTNVINERYAQAGALTTERSTTLSGGAADSIGAFSLKLVSSANADKYTMTLDSFWFDVENSLTGASKTATVEIISSASLNNNDIRLMLEYMGASGTTLTSFSDSLATVLTPAAALPSSSNTWNNPPSTPVKQLLQVTFTPQRAGRVRGQVKLGKVSATVWVNPQLTIT